MAGRRTTDCSHLYRDIQVCRRKPLSSNRGRRKMDKEDKKGQKQSTLPPLPDSQAAELSSPAAMFFKGIAGRDPTEDELQEAQAVLDQEASPNKDYLWDNDSTLKSVFLTKYQREEVTFELLKRMGWPAEKAYKDLEKRKRYAAWLRDNP